MFICSMHDLPHCITTPMHQCMFVFICMFMVFKQNKILMSIKEIKQNKVDRQILRDMKTKLNRD